MCGFAELVGYGLSEWQCSTISCYNEPVKDCEDNIMVTWGV